MTVSDLSEQGHHERCSQDAGNVIDMHEQAASSKSSGS